MGVQLRDRLAGRTAWVVTAFLLAGVASACIALPPERLRLLAVGCALLGIPLAIDAFAFPGFRAIGAKASNAPALCSMAYFALLPLGAVSIASSQDRAGILASAAVPLLAAGACIMLGHSRRRLVARMLRAPAHPTPLRDGVWGATDGQLVSHHANVSGVNVAFSDGSHSRWSGGSKSQESRTDFVDEARELKLQLDNDHHRDVDTTHGKWLTTIKLDHEISANRFSYADVIPTGSQVRVVGTSRSGSLVASDQELLIFASQLAPAVGLSRMLWRDRLAMAAVVIGALVLVGLAVEPLLAQPSGLLEAPE